MVGTLKRRISFESSDCLDVQNSEDSQILQPWDQAKAHLEGDPALEHLRALVVDGSLVDHSKRGASSDRGEDLGHAETKISELQ